MIIRFELYLRKKLKKRVCVFLLNGNIYFIENYGMFKRGRLFL